MVGDRDMMGMAGQLVKNLFRAAEGRIGVEHPVLLTELAEEEAEDVLKPEMRLHTLVRERNAVGTHFTRRRIHAVSSLLAILDALIAPKAAIAGAHGPAESGQRLPCLHRNAGLKPQDTLWTQACRILTHRLR
jgi:hypothetical protein